MSERKRGTAAAIDIDALLQDTWLQVISLRHGPTFQAGEGRTLWERCIADVERVQRELKASELDEASCQHILTAQCALLDEAVKGRGVEDDACVQWYDIPLQGHFLGTMDAGDTLCDRMRDVLREPAPDHAVVTCFQRVMMLGFLGSYRSLNDPERQKLVNALSEYVTPFSHGFAGRGDICLFGEMLSRFFALYTDIYLFNRLIIILQPTGERLEWEEKHNRRIPG